MSVGPPLPSMNIPPTDGRTLGDLDPQLLSQAFDIVLARQYDASEIQSAGMRAIDGSETCMKHDQPHIHVRSFRSEETDGSMLAAWQNDHEDVLTFLRQRGERQREQTRSEKAPINLSMRTEEGEEQQHMDMPGSFGD